MTQYPPEAYYHWPTLRSKLWPITVIRLECWVWPWFRIHKLGNWQHGNYWGVDIGPWIILGGSFHPRDPSRQPPPGETEEV